MPRHPSIVSILSVGLVSASCSGTTAPTADATKRWLETEWPRIGSFSVQSHVKSGDSTLEFHRVDSVRMVNCGIAWRSRIFVGVPADSVTTSAQIDLKQLDIGHVGVVNVDDQS
jgi:hypothetical protein